jgi:hypothetical protein
MSDGRCHNWVTWRMQDVVVYGVRVVCLIRVVSVGTSWTLSGLLSQWNSGISFSFLYSVQTNSFAYPALYLIGPGDSFLKGKGSRIVKVTTHLHLFSRLGMHGALCPNPIHLYDVVMISVLKLSLLRTRNSYLKYRRPADKWKCQVSWPGHDASLLSPRLNCKNLLDGIHGRFKGTAGPINDVTFTSNPLRSAVGWEAWSARGNYHWFYCSARLSRDLKLFTRHSN